MTADRLAPRRGAAGTAVPLLLAASALALLLAPALMPESYSWLAHTTSQSAAQGIPGAWLARLGFLLFGLAVLWLALALAAVWGRTAVGLHASFGAFMTVTAACSTRPWMPGAPFDPLEDALHSMAATAMGFAFAFGVLARLLQRGRSGIPGRAFDAVAVAAATVIPLAMTALPARDGLLQRLMFLIAYLWYANEARRARGPGWESL